MVTTETHQSQDLMVPSELRDLQEQLHSQLQDQEHRVSPADAFDPEKLSQGPVNAITVLTLLDKLVHMLDAVQENQHKMEVHQVQMETVVRGIQADMTKLSKSHSHTCNSVNKLLDKSRKLSVTMKEVRDRMERQGVQVRKLEANHAHLISRNHFKVLIFQEENEIPSSVFVKDPPPFPRHEVPEEADELAISGVDGNQSHESGLHTIDLSSDEDVGLEADLDMEEAWPQDLELMEKSRAEKLKHSSLKKVDSLKKKMMKIKEKTSSLKVSPLTFNIKKPRSSSDSQAPEAEALASPVLVEEAAEQAEKSAEPAKDPAELEESTEKVAEYAEVVVTKAEVAPAEQEGLPQVPEGDQSPGEIREEPLVSEDVNDTVSAAEQAELTPEH
ncbi:caveolae-associated protein 2-like [Synchiropus splendidus]|uniref:caveolae-associated protein 2-like n=1 Tax=Synchiropus splendidus TaxID=270530 RepID=UPI00237E156D|nr:caveolae-associated protein 2-like [Synchiropus splendidus]